MELKNTIFEKGLVVVMFVLVLVVFSYAERDTKKIVKLYNSGSASQVIEHNKLTANVTETPEPEITSQNK